MEKSQNQLIKEIIEVKEENEKLEEMINFLRMENFEYAMKCNQIENTLANVESVAKGCAGQLLESSDNICKILQSTAEIKKINKNPNFDKANESVKQKCNSKKISQSLHKTPPLAHVVNPHIVNGHVLNVPTINLPRVSHLQVSKKLNITPTDNEDNSMLTAPNDNENNTNQSSTSNLIENEDSGENAVEEESNNSNSLSQLSRIQEETEPSTSSSKSPSHSTVLSGTFQEVKIYLNQVTPNSFNETSRKSIRKTQSKALQRKSGRSGNSFDSVTKRKRS